MLIRKMKDSGVEWIGEIPEEWMITSLQRLFFIQAGGDAKKEYYNSKRDKKYCYPVYTNSKDEHSVYAYTSNPIFPANCITVSGRGAIGKAFYRKTPFDAIIRLLVLKPKTKSISEFYTYFIDTVLVFNTGSSAVGQLSTIQIAPYKVAVPPIEEQQSIVNVLNKKTERISLIIKQTQQSIKELKKYKQSLITEAVTKGLDPNVEMKDSGIEWIGNIPEDWKLTKLKFLLKSNLLYGANESGIPYSPSLPRYIRITDIIENNKLTSDNKLSLSKEKAENYLLKEGDLLFARSGASVGKTFLVESQNTNNAFAGYLIKASFKNNNISKFVYYYTLSSAFEAWKDSITIQSTIQNIGADKYNNLPLPIPSKYLQQEIVFYLDEQTSRIDKLITDKTKVIEELESYKKSLIYEYVTGKKEV